MVTRMNAIAKGLAGFLAVSLLLFSVLLAGCDKQDSASSTGSDQANEPVQKQVVRIGYLPITLTLPFFAALEKGYFGEAGLEVKAIPFATADQLTNALVAGKIDLTANTSMSTFMSTYSKAPGFGKVYMVSYHTPENYLDALLVPKNSDVTKPEDLKGKKIGMFPGSTNVIYLRLALANYLKDPETDVQMLQLPPQTHIDSLASGRVDALYTLEPLVTVAVMKGIGRVLIQGSNSTYIVNPFPGGAYVVSSEYLQKNPRAAHAAMGAIYRGLDFVRGNETEARGFYEKYTPIKGPVALKTHIGAWWKIKEIQREKLQQLADILTKNKELPGKVDVNTYVLENKK